MRAIARDAARAERARQQAVARQAASARRDARDLTRQAKEDAKEAARLHLASQLEETEALTREVVEREQAIDTLLATGLSRDPKLDLSELIKVFAPYRFDEQPWHLPVPHISAFAPAAPAFFARMIPGAKGRHVRRLDAASAKLATAQTAYEANRKERAAALAKFEKAEKARHAELERTNDKIREIQRGVAASEHGGVVAYFKLVLERSLTGEPDAIAAEVGYSAESRHLVVDLELPELAVVPEEASFKYTKSADRIDAVPRPVAKRKSQYGNLISQITLKCVDTVFRSGPADIVDCLTVNSMLDAVDPATGQEVRVCLVSVRVTADTFGSLKLSQVQPEQCLRSLKASVSRSPTELLPVKPLVELDMVDSRFVATTDVLSGLDSRPNLMDLTPNEFEGLITNLFAEMGLDTRQTRPSRDGGVDCVAFDPRPVFGGKVVIQAKRYKNTVGVSAVRDLFGTVQNEGASKGILVTTSGYGKAAFDFARNKPLELLDGGNLLHLLSEHAGVDARIIMPEGWADLPIHGE